MPVNVEEKKVKAELKLGPMLEQKVMHIQLMAPTQNGWCLSVFARALCLRMRMWVRVGEVGVSTCVFKLRQEYFLGKMID